MPYQSPNSFVQFLYNWQTLIAGLLAVLAAGATIYFTLKAAKWEVKAAQNQVEVAVRLETNRNLRESFAFHMMLQAAVYSVIEDIAAARIIYGKGSTGAYSVEASEARQRIKKLAFNELRSASVRLAGTLTSQILQLEQRIDDFSREFAEFPGTHQGPPIRKGRNANLLDQLELIELLACHLRDSVNDELRRLNQALADLT